VVSAAPSHSPTEDDEPAKVGLGASGRGGSDRDVRGSIDRGRRGKTTPTLVAAAGQQPAKHEAKVTQRNSECCVLDDPPKRSERRESVRSPGQAARSPNSERRPRGESRGSVAGNIRGAGARSSFGWQKSIGRIARLARREVASPRGEEIRQGASQKEARSLSDARHGWVEGETVRG